MLRHFWIIMIVAMCGCSSREDRLVGTWLQAGGQEKITFMRDGIALMEGPRSNSQVTWRLLDGDRFSLTAVGGVTLLGCEAEGLINIRTRNPMTGQEGVWNYLRVGSDGALIPRVPGAGSNPLGCTP
jgi:hypothetical protein